MSNLPALVVLRTSLETFTPKTKEEAIQVIHTLSAVSANEKRLKKEAYAFLENRCAECDRHEAGGLTVVRVAPENKVYNITPELEAAEASLKQAKADLETAKNTAGFVLQAAEVYYKATNKKD